jgi:hypothetical protein
LQLGPSANGFSVVLAQVDNTYQSSSFTADLGDGTMIKIDVPMCAQVRAKLEDDREVGISSERSAKASSGFKHKMKMLFGLIVTLLMFSFPP